MKTFIIYIIYCSNQIVFLLAHMMAVITYILVSFHMQISLYLQEEPKRFQRLLKLVNENGLTVYLLSFHLLYKAVKEIKQENGAKSCFRFVIWSNKELEL